MLGARDPRGVLVDRRDAPLGSQHRAPLRSLPGTRLAGRESTIGVVGLVLVLLVLPAVGQASPLVRGVAWKAPFAGHTITNSSGGYHGCGWHTTIGQSPSFSLSTGIGKEAANSTAKSCGRVSNFSSAGEALLVGLTAVNFTAPKGLHTVTVHWTVSWTAHVRAHPYPSGTGKATANAVLVLYAYLYDRTSGLYGFSNWVKKNFTSSGNVSWHEKDLVSLPIHWIFNSTHTYYVATWLDLSEAAYAMGTAPCNAASSLNVATAGNYAKLTSIVVP
jgi:hypothetical protein